MKADLGKRAKRSETSDEVDPDLWKILAERRGIQKPKAFRRF
jgi:hypothetical protein